MKIITFFIVLLLFVSCKKEIKKTIPVKKDSIIEIKDEKSKPQIPKIGKLETKLIASNLVNIQQLDSTILVNLKYSTADNFVGVDMYGDLNNAYLQKDVAQKLLKAQAYLKKRDSTKTLLIYDAVRPRSVQQKMWDTLKMPFQEKIKFVSNPKNHSIHNYGAAVDLTIANKKGKALDMGTPYDYIGELAHPILEQKLLKEGKLSKIQITNRILLRNIMRKAGFFNIQTEWWHFNSCRKAVAKQKYTLVE